ncbi:hypothetical protein WN943_001509 [Citrus x changshan-huyou]
MGEARPTAPRRELRKGIGLKFLNRDAAADGNVRESGDVGGGLGKSYLFCLTACPPWKRLNRRQGKSAKWIRNFGKRIGSEGWARGSQSRTRRLSADCSSCHSGESGSPRAGRGTDWERPFRGPSPGVEQLTQNCALNVKVKKFNQARVNGGSNYDSLKVAKPRHLISDAHEWINEIPTVPVYYPAKPQPRERAWQNQRGKKTLLSLTLVRLCEMT